MKKRSVSKNKHNLNFSSVLNPLVTKNKKKSITTINIPIVKKDTEIPLQSDTEKKSTNEIIKSVVKLSGKEKEKSTAGKTTKNLTSIKIEKINFNQNNNNNNLYIANELKNPKTKTSKNLTSLINAEILDEEFLEKCNLFKIKDKLILNKKDTVITYFLDGTINDEIFKFVKDKITKHGNGFKTLFTFIYTSTYEEIDMNYKHKRENILEFINSKFLTIDRENYYFHPQLFNKNYEDNDKNISDSDLLFEKFAQISIQYNTSFSLVNFEGLKGPKLSKELLQNNLEFILKEYSVPTILLKKPFFSESEINEYERFKKKANWLFVFDLDSKNSYCVLETFIGLVDTNLDSVTGLSLIPLIYPNDYVEMNFRKIMKQAKVKDFSYLTKQYEKNSDLQLIDFLNNKENNFDFVAVYCKQKSKLNNYFDIINSCESNICLKIGI